MPCAQRSGVEPEPGERLGAVAENDDVRAGEQTVEASPIVGGIEIEDSAAPRGARLPEAKREADRPRRDPRAAPRRTDLRPA
ncbi:hypothetical protein [Microbacterium hominis]|uniref:Uncharacterized protein n=1 Tax=Microbacterium hominis TaxID=162426 RepID=A0A0B4C643_9MICO|nr:hypothetical protein [Microbacterium hominis]KIC56509.1 hypothetical protein RM52_12840 [Microbacterium hominis]